MYIEMTKQRYNSLEQYNKQQQYNRLKLRT